ncbi:MAG: pantoate--beta-alanine ligase [Elusimicrobiota bacterium]|jgi:pantoate--beta-alanine ligase|nr:pantoate--beta-alanine ligase [Elusimicrobiota bacterium]
MKVLAKSLLLQKIALKHLKNGDEIGLVPTMGALHRGHVSLIDKSVKNNDVTIVSIFVNPTQFSPGEDFLQYPRSLEKDLFVCKKSHVDYVFVPNVNEMFSANHKTFVEVKELQDILCGKFRTGHFRGVATMVAKLFNISFADKAYFGMKDFQQLKILEKMAKDLNFRTKIIACPTVREKDGLALSSRNAYLSFEERDLSACINKILKQAASEFKNKDLNSILKAAEVKLQKIPNLKIEYIQAVNSKDLSSINKNSEFCCLVLAVRLGKTRLIDNVLMRK